MSKIMNKKERQFLDGLKYLYITPSKKDLRKHIDETYECMMVNTDQYPYNHVDNKMLEDAIYWSIVEYVRKDFNILDDTFKFGMDAKAIIEDKDWTASSLSDTEPRDSIIDLVDQYLLTKLGKKKYIELYLSHETIV